MYYYGGYSGTNSGCSCGTNTYSQGYTYPMYGGYVYGNGAGYGSGAAIVLVLFILLVIIIGTRSFVAA